LPRLTRDAIIFDAMILGGIEILMVLFVMLEATSTGVFKQTFRLDSLLYTTLGGMGIGAVTMCALPHTVGHGPFDALLDAAILGGGTAPGAGVTGRLIGAIAFGEHERVIRWIGNIAAFATAPLSIGALALVQGASPSSLP
jgi:hypothetical protein